jgi:cytochrome c553
MRHTLFCLFIASFAATPALAQQPGSSMPAAAVPCLSCHGASGHPTLADVPIIAGQQELYLANALRAYKAGQRDGGQALVMREMVKLLSDDDIETLATWFGAQK